MPYVRYPPGPAPASTSPGWDAWAAEYATLGATRPTYTLGKRLLHALVDEVAPRPGRALDFHCGAGDDLVRLRARGWRVAGCDGSPGMLAAAAAHCPDAELWLGRAEELTPDALGGARYDLILSTTGGFAYLGDAALVRAHRALVAMLAPGGRMVLAHHTPVCAAETIYHLARRAPRRAFERWRGEVAVDIRGQPLRMRLRSPAALRRLLAGVVVIERLAPLLVVTPPFQSGYRPGPRALAALRTVEERLRHVAALAWLADQVVCVARAP